MWGGLDPHDRVIMEDHSRIGHLKGEILHYSYNSISEHDYQNERFSSIAAEARCKAGKRTNLLKILLNPAWAFFHDYILRLGMLNGRNGWIIARKQAYYTFSKHSKLYELMKKRKNRVVIR
jgi:flagellar biosynthesis/type III secretory pathway chaperone